MLCMEKIEQLQRTAKEAQEKLSAVEKAFAQGKQALDELEHTLSTELADLEAQQQARSAHVEKGLLSRYNRSRRPKDKTRAESKGLSGPLQLHPQLIRRETRGRSAIPSLLPAHLYGMDKICEKRPATSR